jgi:glucose-6-phosphate isomerase
MSFLPLPGVVPLTAPLGFRFENGCYGPTPEVRRLDAIRPSLLDPHCAGPDPVYAIAMDVGRAERRAAFVERMLLFGVVTYAAGRLGAEPVRSQGHVHRVSRHSGWSPPEVYEIWSGAAYVLMQERADDDPGRSFAIHARPGEIVIVPPGWAHATISADPSTSMTFGALCDREYGFEYEAVRARKGLAWYPTLDGSGEIGWLANPRYRTGKLEVRGPGDYARFGIARGLPLYAQAAADPDRFLWVSKPALAAELWKEFTP